TVSRRRLLHLTHLVIIVGAASAALAFWRQLLPHSEFASLWKHQQQHGGSFGQFINRNHFALLMEMSLGPTLSLALYVRPGTRRSIYFAITFLIWLALILTSSRGAIISMMGNSHSSAGSLRRWYLARRHSGINCILRTRSGTGSGA